MAEKEFSDDMVLDSGKNGAYVAYLIKIANKMAQQRFLLMEKPTWSYQDYVYASNFFNDYRILELVPDSQVINPRWEVNDPEGKDSINITMSAEEITKMLSDIKRTRYYKALFDFSFSKALGIVQPVVRDTILSWSPSQLPRVAFQHYAPSFFTRWMTTGNSGIVYGEKGSGKTDFSLMLASMYLQDPHKRLISNVRILDDTFSWSYFGKFSEMLIKLFSNVSLGFDSLILLDELTMSGIRRKQTMSGSTLTLDRFDRGTRKLGGDVLFIWHRIEEAPKETLAGASFLCHKLGSTDHPGLRRRAYLRFPRENRDQTFVVDGIKTSPIPFASESFAPFYLDVDFGKIMDAVGTFEEQGKNRAQTALLMIKEIKRLAEEGKDESYDGKKIEKDGLFSDEFRKKYHVTRPTLGNWLKSGKITASNYYGKNIYKPVEGFDPLKREWNPGYPKKSEEDNGDEETDD